MEVGNTSQEAGASASTGEGSEGAFAEATVADMERETEEELKVDEWDGEDLSPIP